jgi:uncharacterized protein (DUF2236 family)
MADPESAQRGARPLRRAGLARAREPPHSVFVDTRVPEIVRRINGERITVLGWGSAILMQLAHPLVAAGVGEHSGFRAGPLAPVRRLHGTVSTMLALSFGDPREGARAAQHVRSIHDRVHGRLPRAVGRHPAGTPYSAHDPELLLWVHVTLMDTLLRSHQLLVAPLREWECEDYLVAAAEGMTRIGVPLDRAPRTLTSLREHIAGAIRDGVLGVSPDSRALADAVLSPPLAWLLFPATCPQRLLTLGLLPAPIRDMYGYSWSPARARACAVIVRLLRRLRRASPDRLARFAAARQLGPRMA